MAYDLRIFFAALSALVAFGVSGGRPAHASSVTTFYSFCADFQDSKCIDGKTPTSRLLQIGDRFYGVTSEGGSVRGTLFEISTDGSFTSVYNFCQLAYCSDGDGPGNYLTRGPSSEVYGVTRGGGKSNGGTIFKLSAQGKLSVIYRFCSVARCADGLQPESVVFDANGTLFGTATAGGKYGAGDAFTIDSGGALHVLYNFCSAAACADGLTPGALILGKDGNFYGTTSAGGKNQAGTVFRMTPTGVVTTLHSLCTERKCVDGEQPAAILTRGTDGNFYGTTVRGGANNAGAIFRITPTGVWETLHSFCAEVFCNDGSTPTDGLIVAKDGSFYGTAGLGRFYYGVLFHMTAAGDYSVAHNFCAEHGCFDGAAPFGSPILATDGFLYGVAAAGGDKDNAGVIYRLQP